MLDPYETETMLLGTARILWANTSAKLVGLLAIIAGVHA